MISQVIVNELKVLSSESRSNGCIEHARGIMEQEKASENLSKNISATSLSGNEKKLEKFLMENWTVTNLQLAIIPTTGKQLLLALMSFHLPSRQCPATQIFRIRHMMSFSSHHLTVGLEKTKKAAVAPASLPDFGVEFAVSLCHPFSFGLGSSIIIYLFMQLCKPEFSLSPTTYRYTALFIFYFPFLHQQKFLLLVFLNRIIVIINESFKFCLTLIKLKSVNFWHFMVEVDTFCPTKYEERMHY